MKKRIGSGFVVTLMLLCLPAGAQFVPAIDTYGTSATTDLTLAAWDFRPYDSAATYTSYEFPPSTPISIYLAAGSGSNILVAPLHLPAGASISRVEVHACDTHPIEVLNFNLRIQPKTGFATTTYLGHTTLISNPPGCALFPFTLSTPVTIDNANNFYLVSATWGASGPALLLSSVRVEYKLQVSPPPGTATFADVPTTHLFFQYVEALAAAGITSGCGGGNFCPDAAVTRGQMAVFLAKALGLHWAP
jgi:hypothetical protein